MARLTVKLYLIPKLEYQEVIATEEWKAINGYEGYYEISNLGRVKALQRTINNGHGGTTTRKEHIKGQTVNPDGYLMVGLNKDAVQRKRPVHVLVAEAFVDGWFPGAEVNHKDFDRTNNRAENLEWVSHSDNVTYSYSNGRHTTRISAYVGSGNPNYGNTTLHEKYIADKELAKEKQSRPGAQNGRSIPVKVIFEDGTSTEFSYASECARYLIDHDLVRGKNVQSILTRITRSMRTHQKYFGMYFDAI